MIEITYNDNQKKRERAIRESADKAEHRVLEILDPKAIKPNFLPPRHEHALGQIDEVRQPDRSPLRDPNGRASGPKTAAGVARSAH